MSSMPPPPEGWQPGHQPAPQYHPGQAAGPPMTQPPKSIVYAKYAMWAGAVLQLLAIPATLFLRDEMREVAEKSMRESGGTYDESMLDTIVMVSLGFGLVMSVLGALLWVLMAYLNGKGKGWARIVATVLYGIFVLSFVCGFAQPNPTLTMIMNVIVLIIGGVATFFLWRKDSSAWFAAHKAPTV